MYIYSCIYLISYRYSINTAYNIRDLTQLYKGKTGEYSLYNLKLPIIDEYLYAICI